MKEVVINETNKTVTIIEEEHENHTETYTQYRVSYPYIEFERYEGINHVMWYLPCFGYDKITVCDSHPE